MGLCSDIMVKYPLPIEIPGLPQTWQTKSLEVMEDYILNRDGRLYQYREIMEWGEDDQLYGTGETKLVDLKFEGSVRFYRDWEKKWYEFEAFFANGQVVHIKTLDAGTPLPQPPVSTPEPEKIQIYFDEFVMGHLMSNSGGDKFISLLTALVAAVCEGLIVDMSREECDPDEVESLLATMQEDGRIGLQRYGWPMGVPPHDKASGGVVREKMFVYLPLPDAPGFAAIPPRFDAFAEKGKTGPTAI